MSLGSQIEREALCLGLIQDQSSVFLDSDPCLATDAEYSVQITHEAFSYSSG